MLHLQLIEQPEQRPGPAVALQGDAPPADLLEGHAGPTVQGLVRPAERGLRDGAVAVLMLLVAEAEFGTPHVGVQQDRKSTRLNSSHVKISYAVFCLKK